MGGDRFIPTRNSKQMDVASFLLSKENEPVDANNPGVSSVSYSDVSTFFWNAFCELRINAKTFFFKGKPEGHVYVTKWIQHRRRKDPAPWREATECSRG